MQLPEPPKITAVEVVPAQPTEADRAAIAHMGVKAPKAVYVVKVRLQAKPPVTSMAWALYVGDLLGRIDHIVAEIKQISRPAKHGIRR